uniref:Uncharacterized protein n=1 Tax=Anopheles atroparvus TaxID=41427 RepID=A0A182J341_ANOAO
MDEKMAKHDENIAYSPYNTKLALLALPSVIFEPRFRGAVRNLVYSDQPGVSPRRQEMRQPRDIKWRPTSNTETQSNQAAYMKACGDSPCDLTAMPREKVTRLLLPIGADGAVPIRTDPANVRVPGSA